MAGIVPQQFRVPAAAECHIAESVLGRTLVTMAGAFNHLNAIHARGFVPAMVWQGPSFTAADASDVGYQIGSETVNLSGTRYETIYVPFWVPKAVDLLHIVLVCLSYESGGSNNPVVTVTIDDTSGVDVDDGCTWTREAGTIPGSETNVGGEFYLRPFVVESTKRFQAADPAAGTPSDPRSLSVGSKAGSVVVAKISCDSARVIAAAFFPLPPDSIG